jgi:hypothetical protein
VTTQTLAQKIPAVMVTAIMNSYQMELLVLKIVSAILDIAKAFRQTQSAVSHA